MCQEHFLEAAFDQVTDPAPEEGNDAFLIAMRVSPSHRSLALWGGGFHLPCATCGFGAQSRKVQSELGHSAMRAASSHRDFRYSDPKHSVRNKLDVVLCIGCAGVLGTPLLAPQQNTYLR